MHEKPFLRPILNVPNIKNVKIIVIIVMYNSEKFIDDLFASLMSQDYDLSRVLLVVVDNASRDNTLGRVLYHLHRLRGLNWIVTILSRNYGFVYGNNIALYLARHVLGDLRNRIVVFLNPDTRILRNDFLQRAEMLLSRFPVVGFAMVSGNNDIIDSLGAYIDFIGNPQDLLCGVRLSRTMKKFLQCLPRIYAVPSVCFAATAIRGEVLESLDFLRLFYVIYFEDTEFCLRAWSVGIPVLVYREFMVWHARGGTQRMSPRQHSGLRGDELNILLHFTKNSLLLTYEYLGVIRFLLRSFIYLAASIMLRRKHLVRAFIEATRIIVKRRIKPRRLPKGLVTLNPRTWVYLWALKCLLKEPSSIGARLEDCVRYGVQRASLEYIRSRFLCSRLGCVGTECFSTGRVNALRAARYGFMVLPRSSLGSPYGWT